MPLTKRNNRKSKRNNRKSRRNNRTQKKRVGGQIIAFNNRANPVYYR